MRIKIIQTDANNILTHPPDHTHSLIILSKLSTLLILDHATYLPENQFTEHPHITNYNYFSKELMYTTALLTTPSPEYYNIFTFIIWILYHVALIQSCIYIPSNLNFKKGKNMILLIKVLPINKYNSTNF